MPTKLITFLFILSSMIAPVFGQTNTIEGNMTLSTSLRYQLDTRIKNQHSPSSDLHANLDVHLVPSIEFEYHQQRFMARLSLGVYGGEATLTRYTSSGHPDPHFSPPPPYKYEKNYWSYITKYTYLSSRVSVARRFFLESPYQLDMGGYISIDSRVHFEERDHEYIQQSGMTDGVGPYSGYQGYETETVSHDPFELMHFSTCFAHLGLYLAPQVVINDRIVLGLETNVKFQFGNGRRQKVNETAQYQYEPPYHDLVAFDYAIRVGYILPSKRPKVH